MLSQLLDMSSNNLHDASHVTRALQAARAKVQCKRCVSHKKSPLSMVNI